MVSSSGKSVNINWMQFVRPENLIIGLGVFLKDGKLYFRPVANFVDLQL